MEISETTTAERRVAESITGPQLPAPAVKACFFVGELADRWQVHPESIRRLIREKKLKTLSGFRESLMQSYPARALHRFANGHCIRCRAVW